MPKYERIITHNDMDCVVSAVLCSYCLQIDDIRLAGANAMKSVVCTMRLGGIERIH